MNPGIYPRLPFADYLAIDAASSTSLRHMRRSPAYAKMMGDKSDDATGPQMTGTLAHTAILEPALFRTQYAIRPVKDNGALHASSSNFYKEWIGNLPEGLIPVKPAEHEAAVRMRDAVMKHPVASELIAGTAEREMTLVWEQSIAHLPPRESIKMLLKARLDLIADEWLVDIKSSKDAHPRKFERAVVKYGYHIQAAMYLQAARALDIAPEKSTYFAFIAVENTPPHEVCVYELHADAIRCGQAELADLQHRYARCLATGDWPGYSTEITPLMLPEWHMRSVFPEESGYDKIDFGPRPGRDTA